MGFEDSNFLQRAFEKQAQETVFATPLQALICGEESAYCRDFDITLIQDSWSWRNTHVARELAMMLIDEKGELKKNVLRQAIQLLEKNLYSLGGERHHDDRRQSHLLAILKMFEQTSDASLALKRIYRPDFHQGAERLIRETLFLPEATPITDAHARQAAASALLTSLRQNVGSCFATAPAILIQQDQPLQFLADVAQLFATGRLQRIYEGVEYIVPLSASWGMGDLLRPLPLSFLGQNPISTLAFSPGLQAAFESAGLINKKEAQEEKRKLCATLLQEGVAELEKGDSFTVITADQLIKKVLYKAFGVTEHDIIQFRERSIQGPHVELMIRAPLAQGEKSLACSRYLKAYESAKFAFKALTDNALLKAWEFTLASLSESKADFAKWNLYVSLGVQVEDPHGIGRSLYEVIQQKIQQINAQIEEFQSRYDHLFAQAKYLEGRMSRVETERESGWVQAEYQIRRHEIDRALSERDAVYEKGRKLQGLYPILINFYGEKIRDYFQEVYDAEMQDVTTNPYDDSPAGFRLMYKHGRSNTALWSMIYSAAEYIQYLTAFFVSTEIELNQIPQLEGLQKEISDLVTAAITTIKRPEFLESSFYRLAKAYHEPMIQNPLENLDQVKRKPWSYISGGTMATLVSCYWGNTPKPQETKRWVESEKELLAFLIDTMKEAPLNVQRSYQKEQKSMLAFLPTHAYLYQPGWKLFKNAWESDVYTYTWIRDNWMVPEQRFLDSQLLDSRMMETITQRLLQFIPLGYRPVVKNALSRFTYSMTPPEFRERVIQTLSYEKWLQDGKGLDLIREELDSILFLFLPLFPEHALRERLTLLFDEIQDMDPSLKKRLAELFTFAEESVGKYRMLTALDLKNIAKGLLILALQTTRAPISYHQKITETMQNLQLSYPQPILFGDTNWVKNVFGFTVNPGTANLEFWRFDTSGSEGRPIQIWKRYFSGNPQEEWGIYNNPRQYGQS